MFKEVRVVPLGKSLAVKSKSTSPALVYCEIVTFEFKKKMAVQNGNVSQSLCISSL